MAKSISPLQKARAAYQPKLPPALTGGANVKIKKSGKTSSAGDSAKIAKLFKNTFGSSLIELNKGENEPLSTPVNVGVILSGGQAPGGHNVIAGIFDGIKSLNSKSELYGFLGGPSGVVDNKYMKLTSNIVDEYRNTGGFDIICSGRTKLETPEQFDKAAENCKKLGISALVVIGGDDSNTNACLLAEYYLANDVPIQVVGCPKTIDGDLKNEYIEASFGFDTATRVYSELIGNIQRDCNSSRKYWHFIKLMGRSASHIALECGLQTQANVTLISEEIEDRNRTIEDIVDEICKVIIKRADNGLNFGVVLIPEGLIEFIPEMRKLITELNDILADHGDTFAKLQSTDEKMVFLNHHLSKESSYVFSSLPQTIQLQLAMDRDPHGNVQVSLIETEKFISELVHVQLNELRAEDKYKGKFTPQHHFFGYEGRCAPPSNFDADYCYSLGYTAAALIGAGESGYMACVRNLEKPASKWTAWGVPITMLMNVERRHGHDKPVIKKALVELEGSPFLHLVRNRARWAIETDYVFPGPIQYFGPSEVCDQITKTLELEKEK